VYKLEFIMHPRIYPELSDVLTYGGSGVRAYIAKDGVTNEIGRTGYIAVTNFVRQAFYVKVPSDGVWTLGLQGEQGMPDGRGGYAKLKTAEEGFHENDASVLLDSISFKPAGYLAEAPSVPSDTSVSLRGDTRLYLDYTGTVELKALRVGGHSRTGYVDASDPSGLVYGPGRVYVAPGNMPGLIIEIE